MGGRAQAQKQMEHFCSALEISGLIDLGWKKQKFTWLNHHLDDTYTRERLDRAMANKEWLYEFGGTGVEVLVFERLDH